MSHIIKQQLLQLRKIHREIGPNTIAAVAKTLLYTTVENTFGNTNHFRIHQKYKKWPFIVD